MPNRACWWQYLTLNAVYLGFSVVWNSLHPIILPLILLAYGSEATKNTRLGTLTFLGLLIAMIVQPLAGALSDGTQTRWGRRRPWILAGTLLALAALVALGAADRLWLVAAAYLVLQVAANVAYGPANGLIPDMVPDGRRGTASGIKTLMEMLGIILAAALAGALVGGPDARIGLNLAVVAAIMVASSAATLAGVRERGAVGTPAPTTSFRTVGLRASLRAVPGYGRLLVSRFWLLLASYLIQSFGLYYFRDVLELSDPAGTMGALMVAIGVSLALVALPSGALSERVGRRAPSAVACALVACCTALLFVSRDVGAIRALGVATGLGMGTFMSVNWAWASDLVPRSDAGKYMGLVNLATAGPSALSRLAGPLVDLVNGWREDAGYTLLFALAVVAAVIACFQTLRVPETRGRLAFRRAGAADAE